jgi:hypothetical protein
MRLGAGWILAVSLNRLSTGFLSGISLADAGPLLRFDPNATLRAA